MAQNASGGVKIPAGTRPLAVGDLVWEIPLALHPMPAKACKDPTANQSKTIRY